MKKNLLAGIVGIATTATLFAQGHILICNYLTPPYNQVLWFAPPGPGLHAVNDPTVQIQVWYGEGILSDPGSLSPGGTAYIDTTTDAASYDPGAGYGPGGYFFPIEQVLPTWQSGDVFTFQLRATRSPFSGTFVTPLWTEQYQIVSTSQAVRNASTVPTWALLPIPEPSVVALAGIGTMGILFCLPRRRAGN